MKKILMVICVLLMVSCSVAAVVYADAFSYGDANKDGKLNIKDATHIQRYAAMLIDLDEEAFRLGDVDASGNVNVKDATMIQKLLASIIDSFPVSTKPVETVPQDTTCNETENTEVATAPTEEETEPVKPTKPLVDKDGYYDQIVRP